MAPYFQSYFEEYVARQPLCEPAAGLALDNAETSKHTAWKGQNKHARRDAMPQGERRPQE
jgi:hypothetical protein